MFHVKHWTARGLCGTAARGKRAPKSDFRFDASSDLWERHIVDSAQLRAIRAGAGRVLGRHRLGRGPARNRDRLSRRWPGDLGRAAPASRGFSPQGRSNRSALTPRSSARKRERVERQIRRHHRPGGGAARPTARDIRIICPQEKRFGCFPRAEGRKSELDEAQQAWQGSVSRGTKPHRSRIRPS